MPPLTAAVLEQIETTATCASLEELMGYLSDALGERVAAHLGGADTAAVRGGASSEIRFREGYRVVRMIEAPYDSETAKAWLFGTNERLGGRAPIDVLAHATATEHFAEVQLAARQFATAAA